MTGQPRSGRAIFPFRSLVVGIFVPTVIFQAGIAAIAPIVVATATSLGASLGTAGLIVALTSVGLILADLPAGSLAARIGDRNALVIAGLAAAGFAGLGWAATTPWMLGISTTGLGACAAVFFIARQAHLTATTPVGYRARVMSTVGGVHRIGSFAGPFLGAAVAASFGAQAVFAVGLATSLLAVLILFLAWQRPEHHHRQPQTPIAPPDDGANQAPVRRPGLRDVLRSHRRILISLGMVAFGVSAMRMMRQAALPLWAEHLGFAPETVALIFGIANGVDMALFYPAGKVMDRFGRRFVAVPGVVGMALSLAALPLTSTVAQLGAVGIALGVFNGITAGLLMTLAADTAPPQATAQYLAVFRLLGDTGAAAGPLALSAGTALGSLTAAIWIMSALGLGSVVILVRVVRRLDARLREST